MAMITAGELDYFFPSGKAPGRTHRTHYRFRTGIDKTHHFHRGDAGLYQLRELHLFFRRRAEGQAVFTGLLNCLHHRRDRMSQDSRPPGAYIIQIPVAVRIIKIGAFRLFHKKGSSSHRTEGPHRTVHSARHQFSRPFK